jgi:RNA polymerase sigma factor (sigma-70 family)
MVTDDEEFAQFASAQAERLRTTAFMMCRDWHLAQDLTQIALTRLYVGWRHAVKAENIIAYAQKILLRAYLDHRRRRSSTESVGQSMRETGFHEAPDLRLTMLEALARLPERDRAIVILRYFEDYSVEQVADVLDVPVSVVKTQTKRSLTKLRGVLAVDQVALFG